MSEKIRIALCITELERGGAEKALVHLACGLDPEIFEVVVYSLRGEKWHSKNSFLPILTNHGVRVEFLNINSIFSFPFGYFRLKKLLKQQKPEVFQSFLFHANLLGRFAARHARVPLVCSGIRVAERQARWHLLLDRWTQRLVDYYVCVSESVAEFTRRQGRINPKKIMVVTNGIDPDIPFHVEDVMTPLPDSYTSAPAIVFLGRLHYQKGLFWLLDTLPYWFSQEPHWHLWLFGEGPDREKLEQKIQSLPFSDRIHLPGRHNNVYEILKNASLLVLPSRWEGMPNVVLEAMAAGLPVLVTNAEGTRELLGDDPRQIVEFGDTKSFCQKIIPLLTEPGFRQNLGESNRKKVVQNFNIHDKINDYIDIWDCK